MSPQICGIDGEFAEALTSCAAASVAYSAVATAGAAQIVTDAIGE